MSTLTTFLIIANAALLFMLIAQVGVTKKLRKTLRDTGEVLLQHKMLLEFYKKRNAKKYAGEQSLYSFKHKSN